MYVPISFVGRNKIPVSYRLHFYAAKELKEVKAGLIKRDGDDRGE